jgi:hypothetical protein
MHGELVEGYDLSEDVRTAVELMLKDDLRKEYA